MSTLKTLTRLLVVGVIAAPLAANAVVYQFNASLNQANEVPGVPPAVVVPSGATGVATLFYNDLGTASLLDDKFDFSMSVFGLSGAVLPLNPDAAASAFHIHGAATTTENAPVRVGLDAAPFVNLNSGSTLLVGGSDVPVLPATFGMVPATPASLTNAGHPEMSFLAMLQGSLAYVNVHTAANGSGEVRGQLIQVAAIPEPETYAMLLAGLGVLGWVGARRRRSGQ